MSRNGADMTTQGRATKTEVEINSDQTVEQAGFQKAAWPGSASELVDGQRPRSMRSIGPFQHSTLRY